MNEVSDIFVGVAHDDVFRWLTGAYHGKITDTSDFEVVGWVNYSHKFRVSGTNSNGVRVTRSAWVTEDGMLITFAEGEER